VFLVGVWRSGTSLLHALLNQHPDVGLMYEAELPLLWSLFLTGRSKSDWAERWEFWNNALSRHGLDPAEVAPASTLRDAVRSVYRDYAALKNARIWGEKSPNYWDRLNRVLKQFPNARFIVLLRDPHGVCRSVIEAAQGSRYFARPGMPLRALFACELLKRQSDILRRRDVPVHVIQYEDLVRNPEAELRGICDFLGLPYDSRMASLATADRRGFYEGAHHQLAKGDRILAARLRDDVVPPSFKAKIDAYLSYWHDEYNGEWPVNPNPMARVPGPKASVRMADRLRFRFLRLLDDLTAAVYCWAPLGPLRRRRESKRAASVSSEADTAVREHV
jgi:hypothetical protein